MQPEPFSPSHLGWMFDDGLATVTLDRPERENPLTFDSYGELRDLFRVLSYTSSVKGVVICGAGGNFSSAGNVPEIIGPLTRMAMPELIRSRPLQPSARQNSREIDGRH